MDRPGRRYRIQEVLGAGGFGTVYRADLVGEAGFRKPVALKVLHPGRDSADRVARLRDEARMLARLRHRTLVGVDALIRLDGRAAIVMELVPGASLDAILQATGPLPAAVALEVTAEVAAGLGAAHEATEDGRPLRLVHRDVKPANVHLTPQGEVKLLDFGVARADLPDREAVTHDRVYGSPPYMSPERLELVDTPAGDTFALGVTLCELLLAQRPGEVTARPALHAIRVERVLAAVDALGADPELPALLRAMLDYEPDARPSAAEVEARCRAIRARLPGPALATFAASLPPIGGPAASGELSGRLLAESTEDAAPTPADCPAVDGNATFALSLSTTGSTAPADRPRPRRRAWPAALVVAGAALLLVALPAAVLTVLWFAGVNRAACASTADEMRTRLRGAAGDPTDGLAVAERVERMCARGELGLVSATLVLMEVQRTTEDGEFSTADRDDLASVATDFLGPLP